MPTYELRDFHRNTGPPSLFERVRFKFEKPGALNGRGNFQGTQYPQALRDALRQFDTAHWELLLVQVRDDTGKFITTTWRRLFDGHYWWIIIGLGQVVTGLYQVRSSQVGMGAQVVQSGPLYDKVERVNHALMQSEKPKEFLSKSQATVVFEGRPPDFFFIPRWVCPPEKPDAAS